MPCYRLLAAAAALAAALPRVSAQAPPSIQASGSNVIVTVPATGTFGVRVGAGQVRTLATTDAVEELQTNMMASMTPMTADMSTMADDMSTMSSRLQYAEDENSNLRVALDVLNSTVAALSGSVTTTGARVMTCELPSAPTNGAIAAPEEFISGTVVAYRCNTGFVLAGAAARTCLLSGQVSGTSPTCDPSPVLGTQARPGASCKAVYASHVTHGMLSVLSSGPQYLSLGGSTVQVYCDMDTAAQDGTSGWTMCAKYDRDGSGPRLLENGFGRAAVGANDMTSLAEFTSSSKRWASIDCRPLFTSESGQAFLHVGLADPSNPATDPQKLVRYTNVQPDVQTDPTNFFDYERDEEGACRNRNAGGVRTFDETWTFLGGDDNGSSLNVGSCMVGDGHHFCSRDRIGARYSNAGGFGCATSYGDTIYWAWDSDDHGCSTDLLIGTGCAGSDPDGRNPDPIDPTNRYNFLFIM